VRGRQGVHGTSAGGFRPSLFCWNKQIRVTPGSEGEERYGRKRALGRSIVEKKKRLWDKRRDEAFKYDGNKKPYRGLGRTSRPCRVLSDCSPLTLLGGESHSPEKDVRGLTYNVWKGIVGRKGGL